MHYHRGDLKESVKASIRATRPRPALITLLYLVLLSLVSGLITQLLNLIFQVPDLTGQYLYLIQAGYEPEQAMSLILAYLSPGDLLAVVLLGGVVVGLITYLWQSLMNVGYEGYCLAVVRGQNPPAGSLFRAFSLADRVILTRILVGIFLLLWSLLLTVGLTAAVVLAALVGQVVPILGVVLMTAALVAYLLGVVAVSMRYVLVDFVLLDQNVSPLEAIRRGRALIRGNVGRAFVLRLSFIGWHLLQLFILVAGLAIAALTVGSQAFHMVNRLAQPSFGSVLLLVGAVLLILVVVLVLEAILALWLQPYITGSMAKLYDTLRGGIPTSLPGPAGPDSGAWSNGQPPTAPPSGKYTYRDGV